MLVLALGGGLSLIFLLEGCLDPLTAGITPGGQTGLNSEFPPEPFAAAGRRQPGVPVTKPVAAEPWPAPPPRADALRQGRKK